MKNLFNKTFFKFSLGFIAVIIASFFIVFVANSFVA